MIKKAIMGLMFLTLVGCQAMTGQTMGENIDDSSLTASVKTSLVGDKAANLTRIEVDTTNGIVSLTGVVDSAQQKARAEQLTRGVNGVKGVKNNLQVSAK